MTITDLNGCAIEVTDLNYAIEQTEYFKDASHQLTVASDQQRQAYWTDLYNKLTLLKDKLNTEDISKTTITFKSK